jgi:hypothetical protein
VSQTFEDLQQRATVLYMAIVTRDDPREAILAIVSAFVELQGTVQRETLDALQFQLRHGHHGDPQ